MDLRHVGALAALILSIAVPRLAGQDAPAAEPVPDLLRNALRNAKQNPEAAAAEIAKKDPDQAMREAIRRFQSQTDGIEADEIKAAAAKMQREGIVEKAGEAAARLKEDGTLDKAKAAAEQLQRDGTLDEAAAKAKSALRAATDEPKPKTAPAPPIAAPVEVPATRPAPGIAGGEPAPVAMPVGPGEAQPEAPAEAPAMIRATETLPSAVAVATATATVVETARVAPVEGSVATTPSIPETPALDLDSVPAPLPLSKKYAQDKQGAFPATDRKHMEILAKESIMDNTKGVLLFTGNVFIDHPEFEIKCDKLEIQLAEAVGMEGGGGNSDTNFKRAVASGGMVEIRRIALDEKGKSKTQIALARIADYNAITKDIVLTGGPPYIQDGDKFIKTNSEDAKIIMRGNGLYEITGSTNRIRISIPVENDGKTEGAGVLPSGLEGSFNRRR